MNLQGAWTADSATGYAVQIANTNQTNIIKSDGYISGSNKTISANEAKTLINNDTLWNSLAQPGVYYWRIAPSTGYTNDSATLASLAWSGWAKITVTGDVPTGLQLKKDGANLASGSYVKSDFISGSTVLNFNKTDGAWRYITKLEVNGVEKGQFWNSFNNTWLVRNGLASQGKFGEFGDGTYSYSVATRTESGIVSEFSEPVTLTYDSTNPVIESVSINNGDTVNNETKLSIRVTDKIALNRLVVNFKQNGTVISGGNNIVPVSGTSDTVEVALPKNLSQYTDYSVSIGASDQAGNTAQTVNRTFRIDNTLPSAWINELGNEHFVTSSATIKGGASDDVEIKSIVMTVDGSSVEVAGAINSTDKRNASVETPISAFGSLEDGYHTVVLTVTDVAGNVVTVDRKFRLDTTFPGLTLKVNGDDATRDGTRVKGNVHLEGLSDDVNPHVLYLAIFKPGNEGYGAEEDLFNDNTGLSTVDKTWDTTKVKDGEYVIRFEAKDKADNDSKKDVRVIVDNIAPTITIKTGASETIGHFDAKSFSLVSFKLQDAGQIDKLTLNGAEKDLTDDTFSDLNSVKPGAFGGVEGKNTLVVYDVAGNSTTLEFYLDTVAPVIDAITLGDGTTPVNGAVVRDEQKFIAHITEDGLPYKKPSYTLVEIWSEDGTQWLWGPDQTPILTGTTKQGKTPALAVDTNKLPDGTYTLRVRGEDYAKNTFSGDVHFTIDNTAPTGTFSYSHGNNLTNADKIVVTLTTSELVEDIDGWTRTSGNTFTKEFTNNGKFTVNLSDKVGNSGTAQGEVKRIDRQAPTISGIASDAIVRGDVTLDIFDPKYQGADGFNKTSGLTINGSPVTTTETTDKHYLYTLHGDGTYEAIATDKAGNSSTVSFTIDNSIVYKLTNPTSFTTATPEIAGIARWNADDEPAASQDIIITLNDKSYRVITDENGIWKLKLLASDALRNSTYDVQIDGIGKIGTISIRIPVITPPEDADTTGDDQAEDTDNQTSSQPATNTATPLLNTFAFAPITGAVTTDGTDTTNSDEGDVAAAQTQSAKTSEEGEVLASENTKESWSLVNLLLTIAIAAVSILSLFGLFGADRKRRKLTARVLTLIPAASAIVALLMVEDFSASMHLVNVWSWLIGGLAIVQIIIISSIKSTTER